MDQRGLGGLEKAARKNRRKKNDANNTLNELNAQSITQIQQPQAHARMMEVSSHQDLSHAPECYTALNVSFQPSFTLPTTTPQQIYELQQQIPPQPFMTNFYNMFS